ncbi:MAG: class I SAM-dependent methyltransferase [Anaerolineae bacterium]|nr:class I SAM-dependent methyltransferase [Anaerolineae bacterium]
MSLHNFTPLTEPLYAYLLDHSLVDTPLQKRLREETAQDPMGGMQIPPESAQFLAFLVRLIGARRTLEVGVFTGYSSLVVAQALPAEGQIIACDVDEARTAVAQRYWREAGVAAKIDLRLGPARDTLQSLLDDNQQNAFDFALIDADKVNYATYIELCHRLIRPGGLIAVDNTLWHGQVLNPANQDENTVAIRNLNQKLYTDPRFDLRLDPIGDGITLLRKR